MYPTVIVTGFSGLLVFLLVFNDAQSFMYKDAGGTRLCGKDVGFFQNYDYMEKDLAGSCQVDRRFGFGNLRRALPLSPSVAKRAGIAEAPIDRLGVNEFQRKTMKTRKEEIRGISRATRSGENQRMDINNPTIHSFRTEYRNTAGDNREISRNNRNFMFGRETNNFGRLNADSRSRSRVSESVRRNLQRLTVRENIRLNNLPSETSSQNRVPREDTRRDRRIENRNIRSGRRNEEKSIRSNNRRNGEELKDMRFYGSSQRNLRLFGSAPTTTISDGRINRIELDARNEGKPCLSMRQNEDSLWLRGNTRSVSLPSQSSTRRDVRNYNGNNRMDRIKIETRRGVNRQAVSGRRQEDTMTIRSSETFRRNVRGMNTLSRTSRATDGIRRSNGIFRRTDEDNIISEERDVRISFRRTNLPKVTSNSEKRNRLDHLSRLENSYRIFMKRDRFSTDDARRSSTVERPQRIRENELDRVDKGETLRRTRSVHESNANPLFSSSEGIRRNIKRIREFGNDRRQRQNIEMRKEDSFDEARRRMNGRTARRVSSLFGIGRVDSISSRRSSEDLVSIREVNEGLERVAMNSKRVQERMRREINSDEDRSRLFERTAQRTSHSIGQRQRDSISTRRRVEENRRNTISINQSRITEEKNFERRDNSPREVRITRQFESFPIWNVKTPEPERSIRTSTRLGDFRKNNRLNRRDILDVTRKLQQHPFDSEYLSNNQYEKTKETVKDSSGNWHGVQLALASILVVQWLFVKDENLKAGCYLRNSMRKVHIF